MFHFDQHLTQKIRAWGQPTLSLWTMLASRGMLIFGGVVVVLLFVQAASIWVILIPVAITHVFTLLLQQLFGRERPPISESKITMWRRTPSFPSAHSSGSMAFAVGIGVVTIPYGFVGTVIACIMFLFAVLIGISRIVVGVHYVTDVIFGYMFGIFVTMTLLSMI